MSFTVGFIYLNNIIFCLLFASILWLQKILFQEILENTNVFPGHKGNYKAIGLGLSFL